MIRVLIVEDSPVLQQFLAEVLARDAEMRVIGIASNGEEALEAVRQQRPDVITMDLHMPRMDGLEAARSIMETHPTPIVIVTGSSSANEVSMAFRAMEAGALVVLERPKGLGHPDHGVSVAHLLQTVRLMSEVKVVRRWPRSRRAEGVALTPVQEEERPQQLPAGVEVVAIGASTGGPMVLKEILSELPKDFPIPILIVQHIAEGFVEGFVEWLASSSGRSVRVAKNGDALFPGHAYVAPDGFQMSVSRAGTLALTKDLPQNGMRPAVSHLFRSVAEVYGEKAVGVLLSGMGKDGAEELKRLRDAGAVTVAQDKDSSVVHGMPGAAIDLGAARYVLSPDQIAAFLATATPPQPKRPERETPP